jgi:hypothetical protein
MDIQIFVMYGRLVWSSLIKYVGGFPDGKGETKNGAK